MTDEERTRIEQAIAETRARLSGESVTAGLQTLAIINGGGLVALYTLLGKDGVHPSTPWLVGIAAGCFIIGLVLTMLAWRDAFRSHDKLHVGALIRALRQGGDGVFDDAGRKAASRGEAFAIAGLLAFAFGGIFALAAFWQF